MSGSRRKRLEMAEVAMRLDPPYADLTCLQASAKPLYLTERYEEAIDRAQEDPLPVIPNHLGAHAYLAAIYSELGRGGGGPSEAAEEYYGINPTFSLEALRQIDPYKDPATIGAYSCRLAQGGV